jgi:uncharacterized cupin superfamily protein
MNHRSLFFVILCTGISILLFSCQESPKSGVSAPFKTKGGLEYRWHRKGAPVKAEIGDVMELRMMIYAGDSCLYSGSAQGETWSLQLTQPTYLGSIQEGLALMGRGDSATFFPVADSVFRYDLTQPKPSWLDGSSKLRIEIGVRSLRNEEGSIQTFMLQQGIPDSCRHASGYVRYVLDPSGPSNQAKRPLYSQKKTLQNGRKYKLLGSMQVLGGETVREFTELEPFYFVQGQSQIKPEGLGQALATCREGDSVWVVLPSWLAYGKKSLPDAGVPAYASLFFQLRVLGEPAVKTSRSTSGR